MLPVMRLVACIVIVGGTMPPLVVWCRGWWRGVVLWHCGVVVLCWCEVTVLMVLWCRDVVMLEFRSVVTTMQPSY